jgi:AcrR family transcriptional regulator
MPSAAAETPTYDDGDGPRVGRPRDPRVDAAIRAATLALLVEDGYAATSIQAIARRAGVGAPSIYRRWTNKAEVVEEAVFPDGLLAPASNGADAGDIGADLTAYCRRILDHLADPAVRAAIPGLLTEYQTDPDLWRRLTERSVVPMRAAFVEFVERSGRRPAVDAQALFDIVIGALFVRAIASGAADADEFAEQVARLVAAALA